MPTRYTVREQDCLASIAFEHGHLPETIWDDPANRELREQRSNPNALLAGDELTIPDLRKREAQAESGQRHRYKRKALLEKLELVLRDEFGEPRAALAYRAEIDGRVSEGETDDEGRLELEIRPDAMAGKLFLGEQQNEVVHLNLGGVDPIETISGAQQRLENLGYDIDEAHGRLDESTRAALRSFQAAEDLEVSGEYDEATRTRLEERYGG